jgi:small subunit ribosomal protein S19e
MTGEINRMVTVYDVNPSDLIGQAAKELEKIDKVSMPDWAIVVKTGHGKDRTPDLDDWWYFRAASVLRKVYTKGPIGVAKLRKFYGVKKNRGCKPEKFTKAGGKIIRVCLQQLEAAEFIKHVEKGTHKGRVITPKGKSFLDNVAKSQYGDKSSSGKADEGTASEVPANAEDK